MRYYCIALTIIIYCTSNIHSATIPLSMGCGNDTQNLQQKQLNRSEVNQVINETEVKKIKLPDESNILTKKEGICLLIVLTIWITCILCVYFNPKCQETRIQY